ncbi:MAG: N-acyl homoserine lactonase family protein [Alphaproteobacteria bacterium]
MTVRLYAMTCGWITLPRGMFLAGDEGELKVPVPVYLIEHDRGRVVYDSGLSLAVQQDAPGYLGKRGGVFKVAYGPGEEVAARLAALDADAGRVDTLVLSHLHWDHAGGAAQIPNARVVVQGAEWDYAASLDDPFARGYKPDEYDCGHDVRRVDGEHDLFGDGTVVCLPTPGHTPGHQSLRVRLPGGEVVLAGDACYLCKTLDTFQAPVNSWDKDIQLASLKKLRALRDAGARVFYGHDPEFWSTVPHDTRTAIT